LGLASLEARLPLSDGNVITMGSNLLGPFPRFPGTITEQVEKVLGRWRLNYLRRAQQEGDTNQGRLAREAALSRELGVYELEVWGSLRFLCELLDEPDVRGVVPFAGAELAAHYDQQRLEMEAQPVIRGPTTRIPIPTDPNAQLPELPPDILEQPVQ
jgi:hypothetical protein